MSFLGGGWKTATARLGPSLRALLVRCGEGAVCEPSLAFAVARAPFVSLVGGWKTASFLVGSKSNVRHWGPLPAGPVRASGPCCFTASFLVGSESNVRHWGPLPAGPVRPSGHCCFAVARAPFVNLVGGWKPASFLV